MAKCNIKNSRLQLFDKGKICCKTKQWTETKICSRNGRKHVWLVKMPHYYDCDGSLCSESKTCNGKKWSFLLIVIHSPNLGFLTIWCHPKLLSAWVYICSYRVEDDNCCSLPLLWLHTHKQQLQLRHQCVAIPFSTYLICIFRKKTVSKWEGKHSVEKWN